MSKFDKHLQADSRNAFLNSLATIANSTLLAIMGRMATFMWQEITWDMAWNFKEKLGLRNMNWAYSQVLKFRYQTLPSLFDLQGCVRF